MSGDAIWKDIKKIIHSTSIGTTGLSTHHALSDRLSSVYMVQASKLLNSLGVCMHNNKLCTFKAFHSVIRLHTDLYTHICKDLI